MGERVAILLDGGFVRRKLQQSLKRFPESSDILQLCKTILDKERLKSCSLFRIYYYDAPPLEGTAINPIDKTTIQFSGTRLANQNRALLDSIELEPDVAVRRGELDCTGWKLGDKALKSLTQSQRSIQSNDLVPDVTQKGVDLRIGLDIATLALKRVIDIMVLVTGDSDFVPAMKYARKEGLRVYLEHLGHGVKRELKAHADYVL